jgi:hypothetical protein
VVVALGGGRSATRSGKMKAAQCVDGKGGVGLAREGIWRCGNGEGAEPGFGAQKVEIGMTGHEILLQLISGRI